MNIERLKDRLAAVPLFSALGSALDESGLTRIHSWNEWPGALDPGVMDISFYSQSLHDAVVDAVSEQEWDDALQLGVSIAARYVPFDQKQDSWHAPTMAAWSAAWCFALEEAHIANDLPIPAPIKAQLYWFERGRWPCALVSPTRMDEVTDYVVY